MADLSVFTNGGAARLAPQLTGFPFTFSNSRPRISVSTINVSTGADVINLSGKYVVDYIRLSSLTASVATTIVLTVDGETIWNDSITPSATNISLLGYTDVSEGFICNSSFVLNVTQAGELDAAVDFSARPIK